MAVNHDEPDLLVPLIWPAVIPVIKADAYGHGHVLVASALLKEGASVFATGSVTEGIELRQSLRELVPECALLPRGMPATPGILSLLGATGVEDAHAAACNGVITMLHSFEQLAFLASAHNAHTVCIKCNTGMNRLGFNPEDLLELTERLRAMPQVLPVMAVSHLSCADSDQGCEEVRAQATEFASMLGPLREHWPNIAASLSNSAGTFLAGEISPLLGPHICRPGIALYGGNPFHGTRLRHLGEQLRPAMSISAPIISTRILKAGDAIGYGRTFTADRPMRVAIMAAGYADYVPRSLSNKGAVAVKGKRAPIIGRVSMQMIALDVSDIDDLAIGDTAWIMGGPEAQAPSMHELAGSLRTITYELLCLLGCNARSYNGVDRKRQTITSSLPGAVSEL